MSEIQGSDRAFLRPVEWEVRGVSNTAHGHSTQAESLWKAVVATVGFFFLFSHVPWSNPIF